MEMAQSLARLEICPFVVRSRLLFHMQTGGLRQE